MIANTVFLTVRALVNDRAGNQLFIDSIIAGSAIQSISPKMGGRPGCDIYLLNGQVVTVSDHIDDLQNQLQGGGVMGWSAARAANEKVLLTPPTVEEIMADLRAQKANAERRAAEQATRDAEVRRLAAEEGIELEEPEREPDLADVIEFGSRSGADTTDFLDEDEDEDEDFEDGDLWGPEDGDDL